MADRATPADPLAPIRSRRYLVLLLLAAVLGVPVAAAAYWFLQFSGALQEVVYSDLPHWLGFDHAPAWWPAPVLAFAGLLVGLTVRYLPGRGGDSPIDGFKAGKVNHPMALPGIVLAAFAGLSLGAVLGPEAPLVAMGGGLAYLAVWLAKRDVPQQAAAVVAATGSFAAISTLLGSPLTGAFLLLEASGLGGPTASMVLVPGLLGAGTGALIFVGLNSLTGYGPHSLAIPNLPPIHPPSATEFLWAVAVGLAAAPLCWAIRRLARLLRPHVDRWPVLLTPVVGLVIGGIAIGYAAATGRASAEVLFSGQSALPGLLIHGASYPASAVLLLAAGKALAYSVALSGFRGGPTFPAMFVGAAAGVALSHLPGLGLVAAAGMGIAAMTSGILRLPMTATLLTTLFLDGNGVTLLPLVIVSAVVSYVLTVRLNPPPRPEERPAIIGDPAGSNAP